MAFKPIDTSMNFVNSELETLEFWKKNEIFKKSLELTRTGKPFVFYEGPPTANGKPHPGHILTRVIKDVFPRYKTMCGYHVERKGGWDTHGLPVEIEVEKQLGLDGKEQVIEYGIESFIKKCRESVFTYKDEWVKTTERMGFWLDLDNAYVTLKDEYIETVWWALKTIFEKDLLYKGHKIVPYCPRCGTALSSHEVAQGYAEVEDPSIFVKFQAEDNDDKFLVWTTTPWTLISNVALAVAKDETYVRVRHNGDTLVLAKALLSRLDQCEHQHDADSETEEPKPEPCYEIIDEFKGSDIAGRKYKPILPFMKPAKGENAFVIVTADFVSMEDGSGIVHIAPAFGEDDYRVGKENGLSFFQPVKANGTFTDEVEPWAGIFVKKADPDIIKMLSSNGSLYKAEKCKHTYPFCWRCNSPLLYYARASWFIAVTKVKEQLLEANQSIQWFPEHIKDGRFGNFLENLIDWAISRERFWGTPLPIWICDNSDCNHKHCVGSREELMELGNNVPEDLELHKPFVDNIELTCPKCSSSMKRVPEVIDCWFDSGCMHTAQWHYPFENQDKFEKSYPADFISEAIDQTRGWFYSLLATGVLLHGAAPYKRCIVIGHVLGKDGLKMSKSKGNTTDPWAVFDHQGADAMRWYFYTVSSPWTPRAFYEEAVREAQQRLLGTMRNVHAFFVLYANIDDWAPGKFPPSGEAPLMDRWLLSRLATLTRDMRNHMDSWDSTRAARLAEEFVDDLSNWYLRRCRRRFWESGMLNDKRWAYHTLYRALTQLSRLLAPFVPFISEYMWQNLVASISTLEAQSVHLTSYPIADPTAIDEKLEKATAIAREIVVLGRAARNASKIKNRQPLRRISVSGLDENGKALVKPLEQIILEELNIKELDLEGVAENMVSLQLKPDFKNLGPVFGKDVKAIAAEIRSGKHDPLELKNLFAEDKEWELQLSDKTVKLNKNMVMFDEIPLEGFGAASGHDLTVGVSTVIDEELLYEGYARELINKIQAMRKESGFEIADRIELFWAGDEGISETFKRLGDHIGSETLADKVAEGIPEDMDKKEWKINDLKASLAVKKA